jgi:hypothetical protein
MQCKALLSHVSTADTALLLVLALCGFNNNSFLDLQDRASLSAQVRHRSYGCHARKCTEQLNRSV